MAAIGSTALVIEVPAAAVLLDVAAKVRADLVREGLPAHVTVLYPFLRATELTGAVERSVADFAGAISAKDLELTEILQRPSFLAVGTPEIQPIVDAACARWPEVNPYDGRFGARPDAHITVAMGVLEEEEAELKHEMEQLLPIKARAERLWLVELTEQGWRPRLSAAFADEPTAPGRHEERR